MSTPPVANPRPQPFNVQQPRPAGAAPAAQPAAAAEPAAAAAPAADHVAPYPPPHHTHWKAIAGGALCGAAYTAATVVTSALCFNAGPKGKAAASIGTIGGFGYGALRGWWGRASSNEKVLHGLIGFAGSVVAGIAIGTHLSNQQVFDDSCVDCTDASSGPSNFAVVAGGLFGGVAIAVANGIFRTVAHKNFYGWYDMHIDDTPPGAAYWANQRAGMV